MEPHTEPAARQVWFLEAVHGESNYYLQQGLYMWAITHGTPCHPSSLPGEAPSGPPSLAGPAWLGRGPGAVMPGTVSTIGALPVRSSLALRSSAAPERPASATAPPSLQLQSPREGEECAPGELPSRVCRGKGGRAEPAGKSWPRRAGSGELPRSPHPPLPSACVPWAADGSH